MASTTTCVAGWSARIRRVASTPSQRGIRRSISTTSGRCPPTSRPSRHSARLTTSLDEISIESSYPADAESAAFLRSLADTGTGTDADAGLHGLALARHLGVAPAEEVRLTRAVGREVNAPLRKGG